MTRVKEIFSSLSDLHIGKAEKYFYGQLEERSEVGSRLSSLVGEEQIVQITEGEDDLDLLVNGEKYNEFGISACKEMLRRHGSSSIIIDITGLSHSIWCPLIKVALEGEVSVKVVYTEPEEYKLDTSHLDAVTFDLSENVRGISPIPGFSSILEPLDDEITFVPILGFEGARFSFMLEEIQPPGDNVVPIIGIPGFQLEYPFFSYQGNAKPLIGNRSWQKVKYASADCPFEIYKLLESLSGRYKGHVLKIAPIGTKPHGLGAILFRLANPRSSEIIYDHPKRKPSRSSGAGRVHLYHISKFFWRNVDKSKVLRKGAIRLR